MQLMNLFDALPGAVAQGLIWGIMAEDDLYKVQVGAYMQLGNAVNMEQRLRDSGYSTIIVTR